MCHRKEMIQTWKRLVRTWGFGVIRLFLKGSLQRPQCALWMFDKNQWLYCITKEARTKQNLHIMDAPVAILVI